MSTQNRIESIDLLKGIAIMLVVIGHFCPGAIATQGYINLRTMIYSFHMPLFMIVSGYLYSSSNKIVSFYEYIKLVKHKSIRLIIPYFIVSICILIIKVIFQNFVILEHPVTSKFLFQLILCPMGGFATFLWFIYTLFIIFTIIPILERIMNNYFILLAISILFYFAHIYMPKVFCLNLVVTYLPFFIVGILIKKTYYKNHVLMISCISLAMLTLLLNFLLITENEKIFSKSSLSLTTALFLSLTIWWLSKYMIRLKMLSRALISLGTYSSSIYLFHTSAMALPKLLLSDFMKINTACFYISTLIICSIGISIPILLTEIIFNRSKILSKMFLGVEKTYIDR